MPGIIPLPGPRYVNPFANASVTGERVDQGVDYAGTGAIEALAGGVITGPIPTANDPGWEGGGYLEYRVTEPGPLFGQLVYIAEGFTPAAGLKVGDRIAAGQPLGTLIKGSSTGIETGFAAGNNDLSYAKTHGGYTEGAPTAAGEAFSTLIKDLGGPSGRATSTQAIGSAPPAIAAAIKNATYPLNASGVDETLGGIPVVGGAYETGKSIVNTAGSVVSVGESVANFLSNPVPVILTVALVLLGGGLIYTGVRRALGTDSQPQQEGQRFMFFPSKGGKGATAEEAVLA